MTPLCHITRLDTIKHAPGTCYIDFKAIAQTLKEAGFNKYCLFEEFGLFPWQLWFDIVEKDDLKMKVGIVTTRDAFRGWKGY